MDGGFDFINGDLGYVIQRAPDATDDYGQPYVDNNPMVQYQTGNGNDLGYIIEVHYIGSPITTVKLEVNNMMGDIGTGISQVNYVGNNIHSDSVDSSGLEYSIGFNDAVDDTYGLDAWGMQEGGLDPAYGIISIPLSSDFISGVAAGIGPDASKQAATGTDGSLNIQASLYYDVIAPVGGSDNADVASLLNIINLNSNIAIGSSNGGENPDTAARDSMRDFFASLEESSENVNVMQIPSMAVNNADNDMVEKYQFSGIMDVNQMPEFNISYIDAAGTHMVIDYDFATSDAGTFANTPLLPTYQQNDASLIGEFRINPDASMDGDGVDWSFDANFRLSLSSDFNVQNYSNSGGSPTTNRETLAGHIPTLESGVAVDQSINISMANGKIAFASDDAGGDTGGDKSGHSDPFIYTSFTPTVFSVEGNAILTMEEFTLTAEEIAAGPENFQATPGTGTFVDGFHLINADNNLPVGPLMDSSGAMIIHSGDLTNATMADLYTYDPSTDLTTAVDPTATYQDQHTDGDDHVDDGNTGGDNGGGDMTTYEPANLQVDGVNIYTEWMNGASNDSAGYFIKDGNTTDMYGPLEDETGTLYSSTTIQGSRINEWNTDEGNIVDDYGLGGLEGIVNYGGGGLIGTVYPADDGSYIMVRNNEDGSGSIQAFNSSGTSMHDTLTSVTDGVMFVSSGIERFEDGSYSITMNSADSVRIQEFNSSYQMVNRTITNTDGSTSETEYGGSDGSNYGLITKTTSTDIDGNISEQEYNDAGDMTKRTFTNTDGSTSELEYNDAGDTTKQTFTEHDGTVSVTEYSAPGIASKTTTTATDGSVIVSEYNDTGFETSSTQTNSDGSYIVTTNNEDGSSAHKEYNNAGDELSSTQTNIDGSYTITTTNDDIVKITEHDDAGVVTRETNTESNGYYAITTYQDGSILDVKEYDNLDNEITQQYYVPDEAVTSGEEIVTHIKTFFDESDNSLTSHAPESVTMGSGNISINYNNENLNGTIINVLSTDSNGQVWSEDLTLTNSGSRAIWGQGNPGNVDGTKYLDAALPLTMVITNSADGSGMGNVQVSGTSLGTNEGAAGTNGTYDGSTLDAQFSITASAPDGIETLKGGQGSEGEDVFIGGIGSYVAEGGENFDMFITATADLENIGDIDGNIINQNGVIVDLSASRVTYLGSNTADTVNDTEWFLGTQADDIFVGASRYDSLYNIQAFNPSGGTDEIFGAEDTINPHTQVETKIITVADYSVMQGGQGVVFILSDGTNNDVAYSTQDGVNISDEAEGYWNNWLPSDDTVIDDQGFISSTSKYDTEKEGATVILDSFGDKDLAFNVDHYIGSDEADLFFGSNENDIFDAGMGTNNFMSGGAGQDELIISQDRFSSDNIDQSTLTVGRSIRNDLEVVNVDGSEIVSDASTDVSTGTYYRIDFADVSNISNFIGDNLSDSVSVKYNISTEYALYLVSTDDLSGLSSDAFAYDALNGKIDVYGTDLSGLSGLTGNFILAEETVVEGRFIIEGKTDNGDHYSTIIQDVEKVTITSDDVEYIGNDQLSVGDDSYELLIGGQGDLGDMLYVATGESLDSTTGVGAYSVNANFITGEIYYSGRHEDFDRSIDLKTDGSAWATSVAAAYTTIDGIEQAKIWNDETAEFFVWYDSDGDEGSNEGYEIAVQYQNGDIDSWGIDNRNFDTFQNVQIDQALADSIKLQFGAGLDVEIGSYRVKYEAAFSDIETIISSSGDAENWNFDFGADSSRSTFYIQVGADTTGENGNGGAADNKLTNVKVERVVDEAGGYKWSINPQAEILVNMPTVAGASQAADVMISGDAAETIEAGRGSDVMMGRGGSDNYKINIGDTLQTNDLGEIIAGDYGVAGDVINEIGGSSDDKADAITLASVTSIDQLIFTRTEIKNEEWSNTLKIDVDYNGDDTVDDTIFVFDHYNQNLGFRSVEKLYLDDGWDSDEIWNLVVGEDVGGIDTYNGTSGQDILMAGLNESSLNGGDGKDILIGDVHGYKTNFILGDGEEAWDNISDMIQNFGAEDTLDLSRLGIENVDELTIVDGSKLMANDMQIAEFTNFQNELTIDEMLIQEGAIVYATAV